jgi:uracil-DNA glycosylase
MDNKDSITEEKRNAFLKTMFKPVHKTWRKIFASNNFILETITNITNFLIYKSYPKDYAPSTENIFKVFSTSIDDIKVVIVGQDPYPNPEEPDGLAFSTQTKVCPKSLGIIFGALRQSALIEDKPSTFDLTPWHKQGVFLLNTTLTVEPYKSNSHQKIWNGFTENIISIIANHHLNRSIKFMLWGNVAQQLETYIISANMTQESKSTNQHSVLKWCHPAARVGGSAAFKFCDHFSIATKEHKIDWNLSAQQPPTQQLQDEKKMITHPEILKQYGIGPLFSLDEYFKNKTVWFTDGSCLGNGPKSTSFEWGVFKCYEKGVKCNKTFGGTDTKKTSSYQPSNIKGEGMAILYVLQHLNPEEKNILYTDSQFWVNMLTDYMPKWNREQIDFNTKKNPELTVPIFNIYNKVKDSIVIEFCNAYHNYKPKTELESFIYAGNKRAEDVAKSYKGKIDIN